MSENQYDKKLSAKYNSKYRFDHPHQFMAYATWLDTIGDIRGLKVLDLACGAGISTRMLSDKGAVVTGVDISESMLAEARGVEAKNSAGNKYIFGDASIPKLYAEEPFDLVVATFMLHYADTKKMLESFAKNIALNLKSGGRFVAINLSPDHPIITPGQNISHSSKWLDEPFKDGSRIEVVLWNLKNEPIVTLTDHHWSSETYEACLRSAGLSNIQWIEPSMHEAGKQLENWQEIEKQNMLVIIEAKKFDN